MKLTPFDPFVYFPSGISFELEQYKKLVQLNESWLTANLDAVVAESARFSPDEREDLFLDEVILARDMLPGITFGSLYVAIFSYFEHVTAQMCTWYMIGRSEQLREHAGVSSLLQVLTESGINEKLPYLAADLSILRNLRNSFIHRASILREKEFLLLQGRKHEVIFSSLDLHEGAKRVTLTSDFVLEFIAWAKHSLLEISDHLKAKRNESLLR